MDLVEVETLRDLGTSSHFSYILFQTSDLGTSHFSINNVTSWTDGDFGSSWYSDIFVDWRCAQNFFAILQKHVTEFLD